ncbi:MAG: hypothetical protein ACRDSH_00945, partial [Pseudonocardiaceae bacterium]
MIGYVLGAPGAGKSAAVLPLRELLPARVVLDWDAFLVPAGLLAGADIRQTPSTWDRYGQLVKIVAGHLSPLPIILMT